MVGGGSSYLGLGGQAADLDGLDRGRARDRHGGGDGGGERNGGRHRDRQRDRVGCRCCWAGEAGWTSGHRRGDDDARKRGGAGLATRLAVDDAHLVDGRRRRQRGRQLGGQHDRPLQQLGGRHHGRGRGGGDGDGGGHGWLGPDLLMTREPIRAGVAVAWEGRD